MKRYNNDDIPIQKCCQFKKACSHKVESHMKMNVWRDKWQQGLISQCGQGLSYWIHKYMYWTYYIVYILLLEKFIHWATYCHKFHNLIDKQQNKKLRNICHLANFLSVSTYLWQSKYKLFWVSCFLLIN